MELNSNIKIFLLEGEQTKITERLKTLAPVLVKTDEIISILSVFKAVHKRLEPEYSQEAKNKFLRVRTADEILKSGIACSCSDYALVTIALFRARKIPAVYVETFRRKWLESNDEFIEGQIFVEIFINKKLLVINPEGTCIRGWHDNRFIIYKKGLDSWDIGIKNKENLLQVASKFREEFKKTL